MEPPKSTDVMAQFGLDGVLADLRKRKMRSTFASYVNDVPGDVIPIKVRCRAGSLMEIAMMPVNEDERKLELFDERVLRNALTLKESDEKPKFPEWLNEEVPWPDDEQRKRRKDKKKRRRKKKRKREGGEAGEDDVLDGGVRRLKKRARKKRDGDSAPAPV